MSSDLSPMEAAAYSTRPTVRNTFELALACIDQRIEGCFVECGVAAGAQIGAMGLACAVRAVRRKVYGFDSFCGIPMASERDDQQPGIGHFEKPLDVVSDKRSLLVSSGVTVHPKEQVLRNLAQWDLPVEDFTLVEGWFQDTVPTRADTLGPIALLRLDGDLYESTKVCLQHLHARVAVGGFVIVDDFALKGCREACNEFWAAIGIKPDIHHVPNGGGPIWYKVTP